MNKWIWEPEDSMWIFVSSSNAVFIKLLGNDSYIQWVDKANGENIYYNKGHTGELSAMLRYPPWS